MHYLAQQDLSKLFRVMHAQNKTHHLAALVSFFCGSRISQTLNVRGEDIFERDGKWVIKIRAAKRGKAITHSLHVSDDPTVDMTPLIEIAKIKRQSKVFGGLSRQYFGLCLKKYADAAGIHSDFAHAHMFRHSAAMVVFDATKRIGAVSQFLAHKSASAAFCYLAENDGMMAQEALDNLRLDKGPVDEIILDLEPERSLV